MTNEEIETLVSQCGYVKKLQPDGSMAFHPHVFESHRKAHDIGFAKGLKHSDWISVSERLPETSGKYLVCYSQEYYDGTYFKKFDVVDFYVGINRFDFYHRFITHWQPIQPPSEVQP